mgnify:FL=1
MSSGPPFPKTFLSMGLSPGFTNKQFMNSLSIDRSDSLRNLAHEEWKSQQSSIYDNNNHRWYLSYASMKNEYTRDLYKYT